MLKNAKNNRIRPNKDIATAKQYTIRVTIVYQRLRVCRKQKNI